VELLEQVELVVVEQRLVSSLGTAGTANTGGGGGGSLEDQHSKVQEQQAVQESLS
jgi:hypothetical protein